MDLLEGRISRELPFYFLDNLLINLFPGLSYNLVSSL